MAADSATWLIQQIRAGNPDAWEQLIDAYEGRLAAFVRAEERLDSREQNGIIAAGVSHVSAAFFG